jgi:excinuclease ABC subunit B
MGDQPPAIDELVAGLKQGQHYQTLLGATGTGKTYTIAQVIQRTQQPTLVMAHNKTLAAQLYSEFKEFFPHSSVNYFVSYYDYYQPEAYIARTDTYIEKDTSINEELDRLRLASTTSLFSRRDVIIVASVSCIYGIGNPQDWGKVTVKLSVGETRRRDLLLRHLVDLQYERNDVAFGRGKFRVRGDTLEVQPAYAETAYRVEFWGDVVERLTEIQPLTGEILAEHAAVDIYPAKQFITSEEKLQRALALIEEELQERLKYFKDHEMYLEAQRIEQRTRYDMEMLREVGYCSGIENYSRHFDGRSAGEPPWTLVDYFPDDFLLVVDESHMTLPQIRAMHHGDRNRKEELVKYGFRLPSAVDNRPLTFEEFEDRINQVIFTSATPGPYELEHSQRVVQQIIRPTGLVDPEVEVKPVKGQVDDLIGQIRARVGQGERVLVTTLTKRMAEDLADYLKEIGIKVHYLHSEVETFERVEILRDLRLGYYDVVVGINLLREGLDLPEVSLVAILDADKEGFLRSETSLIQTIGRAARHVNGTVIMYADKMTDSMQRAIAETNRRRGIQLQYNAEHGIVPATVVKAVRDLISREEHALAEPREAYAVGGKMPKDELARLIKELEKDMKQAAKDLEFEKAALLRDQIFDLRQQLDAKDTRPEWEKLRTAA